MCSGEKDRDSSTRIKWIRERDNKIVGEGEVFFLKSINQSDAGRYYCEAQKDGSTVAAMAQTYVNVQCK